MDGKATTETGHKQALSVSQLVELVCELKGTVVELRQSVADLKQTVRARQQAIDEWQVEKERLKQLLREHEGQHPTLRLDDEYSLEAEDKRDAAKRAVGQRRKKQKSSRHGRRTTEDKLAEAHRHEDVFPDDVPPDDCTLHRSLVVWRIENDQAVLVAYHVYHGPGGEVPMIPGTLGRSEYGIEIYLALTFMVFVRLLNARFIDPSGDDLFVVVFELIFVGQVPRVAVQNVARDSERDDEQPEHAQVEWPRMPVQNRQ